MFLQVKCAEYGKARRIAATPAQPGRERLVSIVRLNQHVASVTFEVTLVVHAQTEDPEDRE
jgi:hypothetical protein